MKKFLFLGVLAAIFFLVPSVQAQNWHGSRGWNQHNYHHRQGPHKYHRRHQPPPRWGHTNYHRGWQQRAWHRQPARWGFNNSHPGWNYNNVRYR